jgi:hypothetical protein
MPLCVLNEEVLMIEMMMPLYFFFLPCGFAVHPSGPLKNVSEKQFHALLILVGDEIFFLPPTKPNFSIEQVTYRNRQAGVNCVAACLISLIYVCFVLAAVTQWRVAILKTSNKYKVSTWQEIHPACVRVT